MAFICAPLSGSDVKSIIALAEGVEADIFEVRLDSMESLKGLEGLKSIGAPLMFTCMPVWEGGSFKGGERERIDILKSCLSLASYVSVELKTDPSLRDELILSARKASVKVIVAYHDFKSTPSVKEIIGVLGAEESCGADIAKVAFMPKTTEDVVNVLSAQTLCGLSIPVLALSMGKLGAWSRIVGPMLGGFASFAAPSNLTSTAEGQYTVSEMQAFKDALWGGD